MAYSELLKDPRWQRRRLEIMSRDGFKCQLCNSEKDTLNVHHVQYSGAPWEVNEKFLITLCERCHKSEEEFKRDNQSLSIISQKGGILITQMIDLLITWSAMKQIDPGKYSAIKTLIDSFADENVNGITNVFKN